MTEETADQKSPGSLEFSELDEQVAVEVQISWGSNVLQVAHLWRPRDYYVGDSAVGPCDCVLPVEKLGTSRLALIRCDDAGAVVVVPNGATALVRGAGGSVTAFQGAGESLPLLRGTRVTLELGGFVFRVAAVAAARPMRRGLGAGIEWQSLAYFGASLSFHGSLLALLAFFTPSLGLASQEELDRERLYVMQQYLDAAAERQRVVERAPETTARNAEGGSGTAASGEQGAVGAPQSKTANRRYAVRGPAENREPVLARSATIEEATEFGMIGLLRSAVAGDANAPTAPWGRDAALGADPFSARGNLWGAEIGEAFGAGGLSLLSVGEGGGGRGEGIGITDFGGLGHGLGAGTRGGIGSGSATLGGGHVARAPRLRSGSTTVSGRLPSEVVQRIIRQNFGRFRLCYEQGLTRNPNLTGRVAARFVIGRDGAVASVSNGGSDLPDSAVTSCVLAGFYGLSFPEPAGGIVTVVYPILLTPG